MKDFTRETDARIVIDELLRKAGWDPADKSQVITEALIPQRTIQWRTHLFLGLY